MDDLLSQCPGRVVSDGKDVAVLSGGHLCSFDYDAWRRKREGQRILEDIQQGR